MFLIAWLASIVELELGIFLLVCVICFTIRNLLVFTTKRNAYGGDQGDYRQALDARQGGRADKRRMEGFSSRSISPRIQVEFSRRMLEDIEQVFTQDMVQPVRTPNGRTHAAV